MTTLATIWMLVVFGDGGNLRQIADYRTRTRCEEVMLEAIRGGLPARCMQTSQIVSRSYLASLK